MSPLPSRVPLADCFNVFNIYLPGIEHFFGCPSVICTGVSCAGGHSVVITCRLKLSVFQCYMEGHLCIWQGISLNEKYGVSCFKFHFYLIFPCRSKSFDGQKNTFLHFYCGLGRFSGSHERQRCISKPIIIFTAYCTFE